LSSNIARFLSMVSFGLYAVAIITRATKGFGISVQHSSAGRASWLNVTEQ